MAVNGHVGYRWRGVVQAEVILFWGGMLFTVIGLVLAVVGRARRIGLTVTTWIALVAGALLVGLSGSF